MTKIFRSTNSQGDPYGISRVMQPKGALPQQAERLDASLPIGEDELLIEVESLNIDSASFHQISQACGGDPEKMSRFVCDLVETRGKHHNPVTGSGGMLIGRVSQVGPAFPIQEKPVREGDRIATLVSLTLTPLKIEKIVQIFPELDRIDIQGHAILFSSGIFSRLPSDIPEKAALAILDVAGAPAQTRKLVREEDQVVVIGGGGKSGILCLYEAKKKAGVTTIAVDYSSAAIERLSKLPFVDHVIQADARNAVEIKNQIRNLGPKFAKGANVVINVANIPDTEMACVLACRQGGIVYFFSMATKFTQAALGAEGVGADLDLRIGNGYTHGHADLALGILRESPVIRELFYQTYC